jgi:hypothetical protein|tara:strand:+ start:961 stop:1143 length:183 start_codon:yes stop_codon:yes gene_type:complete
MENKGARIMDISEKQHQENLESQSWHALRMAKRAASSESLNDDTSYIEPEDYVPNNTSDQ